MDRQASCIWKPNKFCWTEVHAITNDQHKIQSASLKKIHFGCTLNWQLWCAFVLSKQCKSIFALWLRVVAYDSNRQNAFELKPGYCYRHSAERTRTKESRDCDSFMYWQIRKLGLWENIKFLHKKIGSRLFEKNLANISTDTQYPFRSKIRDWSF